MGAHTLKDHLAIRNFLIRMEFFLKSKQGNSDNLSQDT